ncbi:MAG: pyridoxal kinase PdxY [Geminicoccaceae bacterium]
MQDGIVSIQSAVAYGHVGNSAAVFPLQRLGFEVWPVNTVLFSNHTGYGTWRGHVLTVDQVREILRGIEERGAFDRCAAVLSGYLGDAELGLAVLETVAHVKARRADALYVCDPVMGDLDEGFFVRPGIPEFFRDRAVPAADIVTPNQFELAYLAGRELATFDDVLAAARIVHRLGPRMVGATSLKLAERPGELGVLAETDTGSWVIWTPRLDIHLNGTGDAFTALILAHYLRYGEPSGALEAAASAMFALVQATLAAGRRELALVEAQAQLAEPDRRFRAERIR